MMWMQACKVVVNITIIILEGGFLNGKKSKYHSETGIYGKGCAEVHEIVPEKDLYGHGKLYAKVVLKPNSSVGWHRHVGETEPYYILEGEGIFVDDDGSRLCCRS